jgi:hypothetical protein
VVPHALAGRTYRQDPVVTGELLTVGVPFPMTIDLAPARAITLA